MNDEERLKKAKEVFFYYNGSAFFIAREYGTKNWKKLKVPMKLEEQWRKEIQDQAIADAFKTHGQNRIHAFYRFEESSVGSLCIASFAIELLKESNDDVTILILCERIVHYMRFCEISTDDLNFIRNIILIELTNNDYKIGMGYERESGYGFIFSQNNIRKRFERVLQKIDNK